MFLCSPWFPFSHGRGSSTKAALDYFPVFRDSNFIRVVARAHALNPSPLPPFTGTEQCPQVHYSIKEILNTLEIPKNIFSFCISYILLGHQNKKANKFSKESTMKINLTNGISGQGHLPRASISKVISSCMHHWGV